MRPEKVKHALPRIRPSLGVVNLRAGVVEEGMVGVIANNLNGKTILLSRLAQSLYFLRSDPTIFVGGNEKRWHLQLFEYLLLWIVSMPSSISRACIRAEASSASAATLPRNRSGATHR